MSVALAVVGDATDPATFGGLPWHMLEAGQAQGVIGRGLRLGPMPSDGLHRAAWTAGRLLRHGERGGFQYSPGFLRRLYARDPLRPGEDVLSIFQLMPEAVFRGPGRRFFYIDQTLRQLFETYGEAHGVGARARDAAIARETAQYRASDGVICQSAYAKRDVVWRYGVAEDRVHVVLPGANLSRDILARHDTGGLREPTPGPLRLVFVGKDWRRKGLDRLIGGMTAALAGGAEVMLDVIGVAEGSVPAALRVPGVRYAGFVDKRDDRFAAMLAGADVGCLLSRAEAGGISLREFAALGLPTLAPDTGGSPEYVVTGASTLIPPDAGDAEIGRAIHALATDRSRLAAERRTAWAARHEARWDRAIAAIGAILDGLPRGAGR